MKFYQIDPRPQGAEANQAIFTEHGGAVLGIEVTLPAYATQCGLGNLDHHGSGSTSDTPSACEQALALEESELPKGDSVLVTVRPDGDSITAMAVIKNRLEGRTVNAELVSAIGRFDRFGPTAVQLPDIVRAIARKSADFRVSIEERVGWVADLLAGDDKAGEVSALVVEANAELEAARAASKVEVHHVEWCSQCLATSDRGDRVTPTQNCRNCGSTETWAAPTMATVVSTHRFATTLGYEHAPVVVALNPEFPLDPRDPAAGTGRKFTVCRYDSHVPAAFKSIERDLNALEPGWGGRDTILGSPQGQSSILEIEQVIEVVVNHLGRFG